MSLEVILTLVALALTVVSVVILYRKRKNERPDAVVIEKLTMDKLLNDVKVELADIIKEETSFGKDDEEWEAAYKRKKRLKAAMKNCIYGIEADKIIVKDLIRDVIKTRLPTAMIASIAYIDARLTIRILEMAPEMYLRERYPDRNVYSVSETQHVTAAELQDALKKSDAAVSIVGEVATDAIAARMIQMGQVASLFTIFSHHANRSKDLTNVGAGKCLNIQGSNLTSLSNGKNVTLWSNSGSKEQKWLLSELSSSVCIKSIIDKAYALNVHRSGNPYNCNVRIYAENETDALLDIIPSGGQYKIKLHNYNLYLTVMEGLPPSNSSVSRFRLPVAFPSIFRAIRNTFSRDVFSFNSCSWGNGRCTSTFASSICAVRFSRSALVFCNSSSIAASALSRRAILPTGSLPNSMVWERLCFIVT